MSMIPSPNLYIIITNERQKMKKLNIAIISFGCETMADYTELFAHKEELDFVTNASYSDLHHPITKDLLAHGFNVLCEKPDCVI